MIKYAIIKDVDSGRVEVAEGTNIEYYTSIGMVEMDVDKSEVDGNWYLYNRCPHYSEEEKEEQEKERIGKLQCTKRVFVLMLEKMGLDYFEQILPLIEGNRQAKLEWELCVELERRNPLLDVLAKELGVTSAQLDKLFQYANGEDVELEVING